MNTVQFINRAEAIAVIRTSLGVGHGADRLTTLAEVARSVLWSLSKAGTEPVYITRLLNALRYAAGPLIMSVVHPQPTEVLEPDTARMILDDLAAVGDIVELPRGRWLPAPLRLVTLAQTKRHIVLGGTPMILLSKDIRQQVLLSGVARVLPPAASGATLLAARQTEADWLRYPHGSIDTWANTILKNHTLQQYSGTISNTVCYYPIASSRSLKNDSPQYFRWVRPDDVKQAGRYLLRYTPPQAPVNYWVGQIDSRRVVSAAELVLIDGDLRRLKYGLDLLAGTPVKVRLYKTDDLWTFELNSELPAAEHRLFTALGRLRPSSDGRYYPRYWDVEHQNKDELAAALTQRLGIRIELV